MEKLLVISGILALGTIAFSRALPSRTRLLAALSWYVPIGGLWILSFLLMPWPLNAVSSVVLGTTTALFLVSERVNLYWMRYVLHSKDPWVLHPVPREEAAHLEELLDELRVVLRVEERLSNGTADGRDIDRLNRSVMNLGRLSPPSDRWHDVTADAVLLAHRVHKHYVEGDPVAPDEEALSEAWHVLFDKIDSLRHGDR